MSRVPVPNETRNRLDVQVVGNKADAAVSLPNDVASVVAYLKGLAGLAGLGIAPVTGPTYWVDYDLGADTNSGFSPQAPLQTLSAAITAVLAFQAAATNIYTRCRIFLVGSSTPQPAITVLPNYCDIIGIGASPLGDGVGIARIGSGVTAAGVTITATKRGLYFRNIQFLGAGGLDAFLCNTGGALLRSVFEDCVFGPAAGSVSAMNAGFKAVATVAGCRFSHCTFGQPQTAYKDLYGIYASGQFTQNLIEHCTIFAKTAGIYLGSGTSGVGNVIRDCVIGPYDPASALAKGIDDDSVTGGTWIVHNFISATDAIEVTTSEDVRTIANWVVNGTTPDLDPQHLPAT